MKSELTIRQLLQTDHSKARLSICMLLTPRLAVEMPLLGLLFPFMSIVGPASGWSYCEQWQLLPFFSIGQLCVHGSLLMQLSSPVAVFSFTHALCLKIAAHQSLVTEAAAVSVGPTWTGAPSTAGSEPQPRTGLLM